MLRFDAMRIVRLAGAALWLAVTAGAPVSAAEGDEPAPRGQQAAPYERDATPPRVPGIEVVPGLRPRFPFDDDDEPAFRGQEGCPYRNNRLELIV